MPGLIPNQLRPPTHTARIEAVGLEYSYPHSKRRVLQDISFTIEPGEIISILGPNGSGKSTLMNLVAGLLKPDKGQVLLDGKDMSKLRAKEIALRVAYVPQMSSVSYDYSVLEYLLLGRAAHLELTQRPGKHDYEIVDSVLELTSLMPYRDLSILQLSGGEMQMVSIARLLVQHSGVVMFDEPTSALDVGNQMRVMRIVQALNDAGFGVVMTTHAPDHPLLMKGKVALVGSDGSFVFGPYDEILTEERLTELYRTPMVIERVERAEREICVAKKLSDKEFVGFQVSRNVKRI